MMPEKPMKGGERERSEDDSGAKSSVPAECTGDESPAKMHAAARHQRK